MTRKMRRIWLKGRLSLLSKEHRICTKGAFKCRKMVLIIDIMLEIGIAILLVVITSVLERQEQKLGKTIPYVPWQSLVNKAGI